MILAAPNPENAKPFSRNEFWECSLRDLLQSHPPQNHFILLQIQAKELGTQDFWGCDKDLDVNVKRILTCWNYEIPYTWKQ